MTPKQLGNLSERQRVLPDRRSSFRHRKPAEQARKRGVRDKDIGNKKVKGHR